MPSLTGRRGAVTVRVPAKLNLELIAGPRRGDGYHDLSTVFHAVSLFDTVTVEPADEWQVEVRGRYSRLVPEGEGNLALAAARLLASWEGADRPVRIVIDKRIPVAAGLAGGSADAAGALVACDALWGLDSDRVVLDSLAERLGSDVNFALTGGTAIGSGRGERVAPVLGRGRYEWVLVTSDEGLSTPAVYAELDRLRAGREVPAPVPSPVMMTALRCGDVAALGAALANDLQEAALSLRPGLAGVIEAGMECGALGGIVSGSGPTVAFLAADADGARDLVSALSAAGAGSSVLRATGPVHGAHVVATVTP